MYSAYLWVKSFHILFVVAWMSSVFYLPRILVNVAEAGDQAAVRARLLLMGRRLYRFGHNMFGLAFVAGLVLWLGHRVVGGFPTMVGSPAGWLHAKLALVVLLVVYYVLTGRWLKNAAAGKPLASARALRVFNELPVLVLLAIVWLVLAKPF
ncbi:CopD family protein [Pseudoxanthomonas sp. SGNA-20]|uniref:Protoporphyrinogen IX oxidase n=1 Tax=Pseudoxanthomonas taiwanensis J19 TaxID=935569 RepID=A0A562D8Y2_9GAMM|nr:MULTISPECIES: CopD family protein [Pseudoxanthomonas]RRN58697.1 CopD family protein [Pseudoxanthomonas sp. SGNA-20]TWH06041.1 putative membrane protein [Pseudoxanthomonas taiwanensis J19]